MNILKKKLEYIRI